MNPTPYNLTNALLNKKKKFSLNLNQQHASSVLFSIELVSEIDKVILLIDDSQDQYYENFGNK